MKIKEEPCTPNISPMHDLTIPSKQIREYTVNEPVCTTPPIIKKQYKTSPKSYQQGAPPSKENNIDTNIQKKDDPVNQYQYYTPVPICMVPIPIAPDSSHPMPGTPGTSPVIAQYMLNSPQMILVPPGVMSMLPGYNTMVAQGMPLTSYPLSMSNRHPGMAPPIYHDYMSSTNQRFTSTQNTRENTSDITTYPPGMLAVSSTQSVNDSTIKEKTMPRPVMMNGFTASLSMSHDRISSQVADASFPIKQEPV